MKAGKGLVALVAGAALLLTGATPAMADETETTGTESIAAEMYFEYDPAMVAQQGYELRTDTDGYQYAVPIGTPEGDMTNATPKAPAPGNAPTAAEGEMSMFGTARGQCGTASLELLGPNKGHTSYSLNGLYGGSWFHQWNVAIQSDTGNDSVDLDGFPPFPGALNWGTDFYYYAAAQPGDFVSAVASGIVTTTLGVCTALYPRDSIIA